MDRRTRNTLEFSKLQERLHKRSIIFILLDLLYSNVTAINKLISPNLVVIAPFENERRKEHQR